MKARGFTLIELLVVMAVFTFIMALAYQSVAGYLKVVNKSESRTAEATYEYRFFSRLDSSIRSMIDYYVQNESGVAVPLVLGTEHEFTYVSGYSILGFEGDVLVDWRLIGESANQYIQLTEISVTQSTLYDLEQAKQLIEQPEEQNRRIKTFKLPNSRQVYRFAYLPPPEFDQMRLQPEQQAPEIQDSYITSTYKGLPQLVYLTPAEQTPSQGYAFNPAVRNIPKMLYNAVQSLGLQNL